MRTLDLPVKYMAALREILDREAPDAEVWAYGSRINGQAHEASDLDLVLRHPSRLDQARERLSALRAALEESDLPILVEILDWAGLPEEFRREIEKSHVVVRMPLAPTSPIS